MNEKNISNARFSDTVHEAKQAFQCNICNYSFSLTPNLKKNPLNQFMKEKNLMNVNIAMKDLIKKKTSKDILNQFMKEKKHYESEHCNEGFD